MFWAQKHQRWKCGGGEESIKAETIWPWMAIRRNLYRKVYCFNSFKRKTVPDCVNEEKPRGMFSKIYAALNENILLPRLKRFVWVLFMSHDNLIMR